MNHLLFKEKKLFSRFHINIGSEKKERECKKEKRKPHKKLFYSPIISLFLGV